MKMVRRKMKIFLLFTILLSNLIAPQVQAVQATSTDETKVTTATSDEGNHEFSTSQNEIIDSAEKAISTEETKETAVGEKEPTEVTTQTENKVQEKTTSSSEQVEKRTNASARLAANEAEVSNWADFVSAIRNETITKITLTASFSNPNFSDTTLSSYPRKNDLEIDGKGNRVDFRDSSIYLTTPQNAIGNFHMHDITLNQTYATANSEDIVGNRLVYGANWRYRFGNITTEPGVQRLARAPYSEVRVYGKMNISTRAENFYLGSMIMEDGTQYVGTVTVYDYSVFWYNVPPVAGATGASQEFTIGKNCRVDVGQVQTAGRTYPAVYLYYKAITVGENSVFNVDMPGNAVRFDNEGSGMTIKKGAIVNLTSKQVAGSIVAFSNNNTYLTAEPGSYFYVIGTSNQPLINLSADGAGTASVVRSGNSFTLNSPAQYDLRNLNDTQTAVSVSYPNVANNNFTILDSDIDLWNVGVPVLGPSSETYAKVSSLVVTGNGTQEVVNTSDSNLQQFKQAKYRRISGMNQNPKIEWTPITDADKTIKGRVVIGEVPDNNGLVDGEIKYIPVYASENQAQVTLTDTHGNVRANLATDDNGYITYTDTSDPTQYQIAGKEITGIATRGPWVTPAAIATIVIDATPPEPAKVDNANDIQSITPKLTGTGEPNSIITLTVNDQPQTIPAQVVSADGKWEIDLSTLNLVRGDVLQIFLQDQSGLITQLSEAQRPSTNDNIGNINPKNDMNYRDATFKAATKVTLVGYLSLATVPDLLEFGANQISNQSQAYHPTVSGQLTISDSRSDGKKPWRLTLKQSDTLKNGAVSLEDDLTYTSSLGEKQITTATQIVESGEFATDGTKDISEAWTGNQGFKLTVPVEKQRIGDYTGKLSWQLEDVPGS